MEDVKSKRCSEHDLESQSLKIQLDELKKEHDKRITDLENSKTQAMGVKATVAWLFTTGLALAGMLKDHLFK